MAKQMEGVYSIKRGSKEYWYARIGERKWSETKQKHVTVPTYMGIGQKGHKLAVAARSNYNKDAYERREVAAGLEVRRAYFTTFGDMMKWFMELPSTQKKPSYERYMDVIPHLVPYFGERSISSIQSDDMEHYREYRKQAGAAEKTINVEIALMSKAYNTAKQAKKIPVEAMPGKFPTVRNKELRQTVPPRRIITEAEYKKLLKATEDNQDFRDFLICGWETSMRSTEISRLRAGQVHFDKVITELPKRVADYLEVIDVKNRELKFVPISDHLAEVLERRLQGLKPDDLVFTEKGKPWYNAFVRNRMIAACKAARVEYGDRIKKDSQGRPYRPGIVFHCFRHTRITKWVDEGWSDAHIRLASGHKDMSSYREYHHLDPASVMRLVGGARVERYTDAIKSSQMPIASGT
jgi:integrase